MEKGEFRIKKFLASRAFKRLQLARPLVAWHTWYARVSGLGFRVCHLPSGWYNLQHCIGISRDAVGLGFRVKGMSSPVDGTIFSTVSASLGMP